VPPLFYSVTENAVAGINVEKMQLMYRCVCRVGQDRMYMPVHLVIFLPKTVYKLCIEGSGQPYMFACVGASAASYKRLRIPSYQAISHPILPSIYASPLTKRLRIPNYQAISHPILPSIYASPLTMRLRIPSKSSPDLV
jgi:hypothetical protein